MNDMSRIVFLWELVPELIQTVNLFFTAYVITRFLRNFLKRRITLVAAWAFYSLALLIMKAVPFVVPMPLAYICGCGSLLAAMLFYERDRPRQKIFIAVTSYIVPWLIHAAVIIPWNALYSAILYNDCVLERPYLNFGLFVVLDIVYFALRLIMMELVFRVLGRFYIYKSEELSGGELILMLLPVLPVIGGYWLISYYEDMYAEEHLDYFWTNRAEYDWIILLYQAVLFASVLASVYISQKLKKTQREEKETAVLLEQTEDIRRHIARLERLYCESRELRHDVKNHIITLEGLYKNGETAQAEKYAAELSSSLDAGFSDIKSGNPVTDIILEEKRSAAEEKAIRFSSAFFFPEGSNANAFDISVILNNALDNAIENAGGGERFISVSSRRRKNSFLIEVKNSFSGSVTFGENGLPETTKPDKRNHGCGLINIRRVADKYNGGLSFEVKEGCAVLTVMLMPEWAEQPFTT